MNGILLIDKPKGKTSHDMVYFTRRLTGIKKVGHTGTLDPMATGVLPICIGKATKVCDMLTVTDKCYIAKIKLGVTTDTQDVTGNILTQSDKKVTAEEFENAAKSFIGEIEQIPPMFSAIKKDGKKLYELARKGITVEREPRKITIHNIEILDTDLENSFAYIKVYCSKGTYIRTLCEDIGNMLGVGGTLAELRRVNSGGFDICDCHTTEELQNADDISQFILPVDSVFSEYKKIVLSEELAEKLKNGIRIRYKDLDCDKKYRIYSHDGEFLAVSDYNGIELVTEKTFWG